VFEYRQAEEVRDAFARHGVRYLFLGKSGAILLGYPNIIASKRAANRQKDRESLERLEDFRAFLRSKGR
jgi:hypothetical protein